MLLIIALVVGIGLAISATLVGDRLQLRVEARYAAARDEKAKRPRSPAVDTTLTVLYNVGLFTAMICGIIANYYWAHGVSRVVSLDDFWRPILIAPIIFMPVYVSATKQPRGVIPMLVAFQNGFFWQTVFDRSKASA